MHILVTGSKGFIGKNLTLRLKEKGCFRLSTFDKEDSIDSLESILSNVDTVIHLAGVNRPDSEKEFKVTNEDLTKALCSAISNSGRNIPIIFTSSTQAELDNPYGISKKNAEQAIEEFSLNNKNPSIIFRLPGIFGKWCKSNYNSVVATFCFNIANGLPIQIDDPHSSIELIYIDDLISEIIHSIESDLQPGVNFLEVTPKYVLTVGELAAQIQAFRNCRDNLMIERVGSGLVRALYSTYLSYLLPKDFLYSIPSHKDERGSFIEMIKTKDSGQTSFFTIKPGFTRGQHYHHTKTEKFLVINGEASFGFRNVLDNESHEIIASENVYQIIESIPGWTHNITNIGNKELLVLCWANEILDRDKPDTIALEV